MNKEKEIQLQQLKADIMARVERKFRKGDREHKQDLMALNLIEEAVSEQIDGLVYLLLEIKRRRDGSAGQSVC